MEHKNSGWGTAGGNAPRSLVLLEPRSAPGATPAIWIVKQKKWLVKSFFVVFFTQGKWRAQIPSRWFSG